MRVAVVTGASSGIGAVLCAQLREHGWYVVGLSRRPAPECDEHETCDVGDREDVARVAAAVLERHPSIELLVNNAGVGVRDTFLDAPLDKIEEAVRVNYLGSVWTLRAFLPGLKPGSHVVNIVSVAGTVAYGPYSAAKHAQLAFSRSVAVELGHRGVSVHTVNPGYVETPGFPQKEQWGPMLYRLVVHPPYVARRVIGAVDHDRREITIPAWYRPASWLQAIFPGTTARLRTRFGPKI